MTSQRMIPRNSVTTCRVAPVRFTLFFVFAFWLGNPFLVERTLPRSLASLVDLVSYLIQFIADQVPGHLDWIEILLRLRGRLFN